MPSPTKARKKEKHGEAIFEQMQIKEPDYLLRKYSSEELLLIFEYAMRSDFSKIEVFRKDESDEQDPEILLKDILTLSTKDPKIGQDVSINNIPYALAILIKRGMMNWDLIDTQDAILKCILSDLKKDFDLLFKKCLKRAEQKKLPINKLFSQENIHENLAVAYDLQMWLIAFISNLSADGYILQAKAIHEFMRVVKYATISKRHFGDYLKDTLRLIAPVILQALGLGVVANKEANILVTSLLSMSISNPIFDEPYDAQLYLLYYRLNEQSKTLKVGISLGLFVSVERQLTLHEEVTSSYKSILNTYFSSKTRKQAAVQMAESKSLMPVSVDDKTTQGGLAVFHFFSDMIKRCCQFESVIKAQEMHNFIFLLRSVYQSEENKAEIGNLYVKALRNFLLLPTLDTKADALFDNMVLEYLIKDANGIIHELYNDHPFDQTFSLEKYAISYSDTQDYRLKLESENEKLQREMQLLRLEVLQLRLNSVGQVDDKTRLEQDVQKLEHKLKEVSIGIDDDDKESTPSSPKPTRPRAISKGSRSPKHSPKNSPNPSPTSSPASSPPTGRHFLSKFVPGKGSTGSEIDRSMFLTEQKLNSEPKPGISRTLSEGSFLKHKPRKSSFS